MMDHKLIPKLVYFSPPLFFFTLHYLEILIVRNTYQYAIRNVVKNLEINNFFSSVSFFNET